MAASPQRWHAAAGERLLRELGADAVRGLGAEEAARRLSADGPNELPEPPGINPWVLFLGQFKSLVIWMLIVAGLISGLLGEPVDAAAILAIVFLNACIGFYQEYNAERSISALRKMITPSAKVLRNGRVENLPAKQVVRGDIVEIEAGDMIPADARLLECADLRCTEAALTGESEAVDKTAEVLADADLPIGDRRNMIFMGTSAAAGAGRALVVGTGLATEIGRIAALLQSAAAEEQTPLQKRLDAFGRSLVWVCLGLVTVLFLLGLLRGMDPFQMFLTSISLAVAAAPEGLPAVVTVALALGVQRMARRNALVRRLPAVETLGSATVICTDKTGTLTVGEMTVRELYVGGETYAVEGEGLDPAGRVLFSGAAPDAARLSALHEFALLQTGAVTADLYQEDGRWKLAGDPTEGALLTAARKLQVTPESLAGERLFAYPFDSDRKRAAAVRRWSDGGLRVLVNGAPDLLLALCAREQTATGARPLDDAGRKRILAANAAMAGRGLRVIGSAYRELPGAQIAGARPRREDVEADLVFAGLSGMYDPPRPEAKRAVARCRDAGVKVVMITGDHPRTAQAIGADLGILGNGDDTVTGMELDAMDEGELEARVERVAIFARVSAEHKLRVVRAWKARGAVVAMTGDGVNDAPALKGAHIGIAMGRSGTEVTKQASDMLITDDNFASIVAAVEEGRGIYTNIRKTLQFLLGGNTGELLVVTVAMISGLPAPLLPIQLLWINLFTDGLPALCLAAERINPDVMKHRPRPREEPLANRPFLFTLVVTGFLTAGVSLGLFLWGLEHGGREVARSYAFTSLVFAELLRSLGARSESRPLWQLDPRGNPGLLAVVALSIAMQIFAHDNAFLERVLKLHPLSMPELFALLGFSAIPLAVLEIVKVAAKVTRRLPKPGAAAV